MKRIVFTFLFPLTLSGCDFDDVPRFVPEQGHTDYRQEMRDLVQDISRYAKSVDSSFIIIPNGGVELITTNGKTNGTPDSAYLNAIDGINQNGVFYGYSIIDQPTPEAEQERLLDFLDIAQDDDVSILVTDFALSEVNIDDAYELAEGAGYNAFVTDSRTLDDIPIYPPEPNEENRNDIEQLLEARNFLSLTNTRLYSTPQELVDAINDTNYDLIIIDFFFNGAAYTEDQIESLKVKSDGGSRLLLTTMNIGQAESDRFYWESHWYSSPPSWLKEEDLSDRGHYYVNYWQEAWRDLLFGETSDYLDKILDAGFDGVLLEGIEVYEHLEEKKESDQ
ncbi:hypothetical protein Q2E61_07835 [Microbulbifer thermotolerans]|uniref:hypothetical protein n=1 Tax=Microbulbifer thermotolerans TaxID=252514 RepID=UPI002672DC0B|nr:hypothetical protein [Microbulbifer thermotolerans]WKT62095.1 hypothetical protein Q2E61_07835 [Microbulbifer thermotolerans]